MSIDLNEFWTHVSVLEIVIAALAGLQAGAFYAWSQRLGTHFFHSAILSASFFTAIIISSALVSRTEWEEWLGVWLLWTIFELGVAAGYKIRKWWFRRSRNAH